MLYYAIDQNRQIRYLPDYFSLLHSPFGAVLNGAAFVVAMKIKSRAKPKPPQKVLYVCNRKKCKPCVPGCKWTSDINYALYSEHTDFSPGDGGLFERIRK